VVTNLPAGVSTYNATGMTSADDPFVQYDLPLAAGASVDFLVEFHDPARTGFPTPSYSAEGTTPSSVTPSTGPIIRVTDRSSELGNGRFLVEFGTVPGRRYLIEYSGDMKVWKSAQPAITAPTSRIQGVDDGPPKTDRKPSVLGSGLYRVR
jgi:hypothetical protein